MEAPLTPFEPDVSTRNNRSPQPEKEPSPDPSRPVPSDRRGTDTPPKRPRRRSTTITSTPVTAPPQLRCPGCNRLLLYRETLFSGVNPIERWDYFECHTCGTFVYRDRTRELRPSPSD